MEDVQIVGIEIKMKKDKLQPSTDKEQNKKLCTQCFSVMITNVVQDPLDIRPVRCLTDVKNPSCLDTRRCPIDDNPPIIIILVHSHPVSNSEDSIHRGPPVHSSSSMRGSRISR